jgi:AbrB family looped-hinge helix DNA binding protein
MSTVKLGEKGQITLPKDFRDQHNFSKGTCFRLVDQGNGIISIIPIRHASEMEVPVFLSSGNHSIEEMNQAIGDEIAEEFK